MNQSSCLLILFSSSADSLVLAKERLRKMRWWHQRLRRLHQDALPSPALQMARSIVELLCQGLSGGQGDINPMAVAVAMACQQARAESRLEAQNQIAEMLESKRSDEDLLQSVQWHFFAACFGLSSSALFPEMSASFSTFHSQVIL
jgi:hypothetical protein